MNDNAIVRLDNQQVTVRIPIHDEDLFGKLKETNGYDFIIQFDKVVDSEVTETEVVVFRDES